jgi:hypothetical protein
MTSGAGTRTDWHRFLPALQQAESLLPAVRADLERVAHSSLDAALEPELASAVDACGRVQDLLTLLTRAFRQPTKEECFEEFWAIMLPALTDALARGWTFDGLA